MWVIELIDKGGGCDARDEYDETGCRCFSWVSPSLSVEVAQSRNSSFQMGVKVCGVPTHMWSTTPCDVTVFSVPFQSEFPLFSLVISRKLLLMQESIICSMIGVDLHLRQRACSVGRVQDLYKFTSVLMNRFLLVLLSSQRFKILPIMAAIYHDTRWFCVLETNTLIRNVPGS